jgi:hypothetical protein
MHTHTCFGRATSYPENNHHQLVSRYREALGSIFQSIFQTIFQSSKQSSSLPISQLPHIAGWKVVWTVESSTRVILPQTFRFPQFPFDYEETSFDDLQVCTIPVASTISPTRTGFPYYPLSVTDEARPY